MTLRLASAVNSRMAFPMGSSAPVVAARAAAVAEPALAEVLPQVQAPLRVGRRLQAVRAAQAAVVVERAVAAVAAAVVAALRLRLHFTAQRASSLLPS